MTDKIDSKDLAKSMGKDQIYFRNPTHVFEGENAETQSDIVKAAKGMGKRLCKEVLKYGPDNKRPILPGFMKIKELDKDELIKLCKSLMRYKPNIYKVHIVLGDYQDKQAFTSRQVNELHFDTPKDQTWVSDRLGEILSNNVVSLRFEITSAAPGRFGTECEAYYVDSATYNAEEDENFEPMVLIEYFPN